MACADCEGLATEVSKIGKLLWGNGDPEKGLIVRVQRMDDSMERMDEKLEEIRKFLAKAFWTAVAGLVTLLAGVAVVIFTTHWK